jgi:hypothetical protein
MSESRAPVFSQFAVGAAVDDQGEPLTFKVKLEPETAEYEYERWMIEVVTCAGRTRRGNTAVQLALEPLSDTVDNLLDTADPKATDELAAAPISGDSYEDLDVTDLDVTEVGDMDGTVTDTVELEGDEDEDDEDSSNEE